MRLHGVMQEIADIIGRETALLLVGQLPRCYPASRKAETVVLYVPKTLKPDHPLVRMIGWHAAHKLVQHFGGEILFPGNCRDVYRPFRDASIANLVKQGLPSKTVAEWFGVSDRHVKNVVREIPQEDLPKAANDNAPVITPARANGKSN